MRPERSYQPKLVVETADNTVEKRLQWHDVHQGARASPTTNPKLP